MNQINGILWWHIIHMCIDIDIHIDILVDIDIVDIDISSAK